MTLRHAVCPRCLLSSHHLAVDRRSHHSVADLLHQAALDRHRWAADRLAPSQKEQR